MNKAEQELEKRTKEDLRELVAEKLIFKPRLKGKDGLIYKAEKCYPHHVLMSTEFGFKRCFTLAEVYYGMA